LESVDLRRHTFENLSFEFWKKFRPPVNKKYREGISEVDVLIKGLTHPGFSSPL